LDHEIVVFDKDGNYVENITSNVTAGTQNIWSSGGRLYLANGSGGVPVLDAGGSYCFTIRTNLANAEDVFVADKVYVLDSGTELDVFGLNGSYDYTINLSAVGTVVSICGDGPLVSDGYLYLTTSKGDIVVIDQAASYLKRITDGLGTDVWGVDSAESIFAIDRANGIVEISRGCRIWVVGAYGESDWTEV
jgi:hypothetical protein